MSKRGPTIDYGWVRRWCTLSQARLEYFADERSRRRKGTIPVSLETRAVAFRLPDTICNPCAPGVAGAAAKHCSEKPCGFVLDVDPSGGKCRRLFYFDAGSLLSLQAWIDAIARMAAAQQAGTPLVARRVVNRVVLLALQRTNVRTAAHASKEAKNGALKLADGLVARPSFRRGERGERPQAMSCTLEQPAGQQHPDLDAFNTIRSSRKCAQQGLASEIASTVIANVMSLLASKPARASYVAATIPIPEVHAADGCFGSDDENELPRSRLVSASSESRRCSLVTRKSLTGEAIDQASVDQHSPIWVNGDKFDLSVKACSPLAGLTETPVMVSAGGAS